VLRVSCFGFRASCFGFRVNDPLVLVHTPPSPSRAHACGVSSSRHSSTSTHSTARRSACKVSRFRVQGVWCGGSHCNARRSACSRASEMRVRTCFTKRLDTEEEDDGETSREKKEKTYEGYFRRAIRPRRRTAPRGGAPGGAWSLGFGVWGFGLGVRGLGFGVEV
jgi:hypothetical protein